tara:strand:+ start:303 stop:656 length:354 start_codon:yes stop_codon:yes gene_type:complete
MTEKNDTGFKKVQIVSSLVVSHKSEVDLEYYLNFLDKHGHDFFERLNNVGLISWRVSRVFNKVGSVKTNEVYIYRNQEAYLKGQKVIEKFLKDYESFYKNITAKVEATRGIVLFQFN